jgi:hypothetical protein
LHPEPAEGGHADCRSDSNNDRMGTLRFAHPAKT